jgi:purine-binding chemotaxis protein CheW
MDSAIAANAEKSASAGADRRAGKYLAFHLGAEEFGIPVLSVREIMGLQDITAVPHTPAHVRGVINLRGKVIPVIDLRLKFGLPAVEYGQRTSIIVVRVAELMMGIVVDGVSEVLNLSGADIEDTPNFGEGISTPYILGMAKTKGKVRMLLDIEQALTRDEIAGLGALGVVAA